MDRTEFCPWSGHEFRYNIELVPRQASKLTGGIKLPLCPSCLHVVNNKRANCNLQPIPEPIGAYLDLAPTVDEDDYL